MTFNCSQREKVHNKTTTQVNCSNRRKKKKTGSEKSIILKKHKNSWKK